MNAVGRQLTDAINRSLKPAGFKRRRNQWEIQSAEVVGALNLQKSDYSNKYYLNIAFIPRDRMPGEIPHYYDFDIGCRATNLPRTELLESLLTYSDDCKVVSENKVADLSACVANVVVPFMQSHLSMSSLLNLVESDESRSFMKKTVGVIYLKEKTQTPKSLAPERSAGR